MSDGELGGFKISYSFKITARRKGEYMDHDLLGTRVTELVVPPHEDPRAFLTKRILSDMDDLLASRSEE